MRPRQFPPGPGHPPESVPLAESLRMRCLPESAMYRLPAASAVNPRRVDDVAHQHRQGHGGNGGRIPGLDRRAAQI